MKTYFFCFKQISKCACVTHVSTCIFQGLYKNIVFRSVAIVTKKLCAILEFFSQTQLFSALYPIKKNYYLLIVSKFHDESVKNKMLGQKTTGPPSLFRVKPLNHDQIVLYSDFNI